MLLFPLCVRFFCVSRHQQIKGLFDQTLPASGKTVLKQLEKLDVDSEDFTRQLTELRGLRNRSRGELENMCCAAKLVKAIGTPGRIRASNRRQVASLLAGPFAAMLDRAP